MSSTADIPNGGVSFWWQQIGIPNPRPPLVGNETADVCIIGAGLTGLWTAYYLKKAQPDLDIVVLEREFAGFGASGRNGGWLSAELAGSRERYAAAHGRDAVTSLLREMQNSVDEVIRIAAQEGIQADIVKDGLVSVARNQAQLQRLETSMAEELAWGMTVQDHRRLEADEMVSKVRVDGALAASFTPHAARVHPARLVSGVAMAVERLGGRIFEQTQVREIDNRMARCATGTVRARVVLRCLEGFSASMPGSRREWLPMNSSMIITEPLTPRDLERINWQGSELLGDYAHAYFYAQRTTDNRIALGGRGVPYRFGSRTDVRGKTQTATIESLSKLLGRLFPDLGRVSVAHAWCGVLGVPRDWCTTIGFDVGSGRGWAGGYVGSGLTTTNLAGRTLTDLVLGRDTPIARLPWANRDVRRWEPEPLRWLGVQSIYRLYRTADKRETRGRTQSRFATVADVIAGR